MNCAPPKSGANLMVETDAEFIARMKAIAERGRPIYELSIKRLLAMVEDRERERDEFHRTAQFNADCATELQKRYGAALAGLEASETEVLRLQGVVGKHYERVKSAEREMDEARRRAFPAALASKDHPHD